MDREHDASRRRFFKVTGIAGAGLLATGLGASAGESQGKGGASKEEEVSPAEDLMRGHGVLKRILLVYREAVRRLEAKEDLPPEPIADAAGIIRRFIEDYHGKLEEEHVFPRFRKAGNLVDLVDELARQHEAGRKLTDRVLRLANAQALKSADDRRVLTESLGQFVRMFEPHEAREDTVLFPAFRTIVSPREYDALGEDFEEKEHDLLVSALLVIPGAGCTTLGARAVHVRERSGGGRRAPATRRPLEVRPEREVLRPADDQLHSAAGREVRRAASGAPQDRNAQAPLPLRMAPQTEIRI